MAEGSVPAQGKYQVAKKMLDVLNGEHERLLKKRATYNKVEKLSGGR